MAYGAKQALKAAQDRGRLLVETGQAVHEVEETADSLFANTFEYLTGIKSNDFEAILKKIESIHKPGAFQKVCVGQGRGNNWPAIEEMVPQLLELYRPREHAGFTPRLLYALETTIPLYIQQCSARSQKARREQLTTWQNQFRLLSQRNMVMAAAAPASQATLPEINQHTRIHSPRLAMSPRIRQAPSWWHHCCAWLPCFKKKDQTASHYVRLDDPT